MEVLKIIDKKRLGEELTKEEIDFIFNEYLKKLIPDYQMSSMLMAIAINGMTDEETINLTDVFINSGETLDLSKYNGLVVDKHSTGGVGDKVTFIIVPVLASCGLKVCKMSGRGLGITGGTIDKLESIKGIKTSLTNEEIIDSLDKLGMVICSQSENLAPMDKVIYSLRDVTATVSSLPLIAASIMSKKIAAGSDKIFIDLKVGKGALIKTIQEAEGLSELFSIIAKHYNKEVYVEFSNMNRPLGASVGNGIEILEAMDILQGKEKNNLTKLCTKIIIKMLMSGKNITKEEAEKEAEAAEEEAEQAEAEKEAAEAISSKKAYNKFLEYVKYQGGDISSIAISNKRRIVKSNKSGIIKTIDAEKIGTLVKNMGGGRNKKEDEIDRSVGIYFFKFTGQEVKVGEELCTLFIGEKDVTDEEVLDCYVIEDNID